jgi:hypothetical protein
VLGGCLLALVRPVHLAPPPLSLLGEKHISHWIEHQTGWSIKKLAPTARRYCTIQIDGGR